MVDVGDVKERERKQKQKEDEQKKAHALVVGAVYMNDLARSVNPQPGNPIYPPGAVIVRERLKAVDSPAAELLAVMIKREKGFNRAANDWEFLLVEGGLTKIKKRQKTGECQRCHLSNGQFDFVIGNYAHQVLPLQQPN